MWLSICGFGMIIGTHPHLSEALGSSSQTWFVILNSIQDRWEHPQAINVAAYYWIPNQVWDDGICKRLTWKRMYILWHNVIQQHCGWAGLIFITHPFMNLELRNEVLRKPIMNCFIVKAPSSNPSSRYSSSQTWFGNQMRTPSSYQRCGIRLSWIKFRMTNQVQDDDGSSPGWQIPSASLERGCVHHSLFIMHCSLCIVKRSSAQANYELLIMSYALYNVRACVCVWGVLNHLNPFYGEKRHFMVKKRCFTAGKRRFSMRKAAVFNQ